MNIKDVGEFGLIDIIKRLCESEENSDLVAGIGDDAAVIKGGRPSASLVSTDMLIEGVHFNLDYTSPHHLGEKSVSVNVSDIAAMGGTPVWALLSLGLPEETALDFVEEFSAGAAKAFRSYGIKLIGGDTVSSKSGIIISLTLLGEAPVERIIRRNGAADGDQIFVTGTLGDSALGLEILKRGIREDSAEPEIRKLIERHISPMPRLKESNFIAQRRIATSMIDVSDGLIQDLSHICRESGVHGKVLIDRIPLSEESRKNGNKFGFGIEDYIVGGEDYELLFTVPLEKVEELDQLEKATGCPVTHIGEIVEGEGVDIYDSLNNPITLKKKGYVHF